MNEKLKEILKLFKQEPPNRPVRVPDFVIEYEAVASKYDFIFAGEGKKHYSRSYIHEDGIRFESGADGWTFYNAFGVPAEEGTDAESLEKFLR